MFLTPVLLIWLLPIETRAIICLPGYNSDCAEPGDPPATCEGSGGGPGGSGGGPGGCPNCLLGSGMATYSVSERLNGLRIVDRPGGYMPTLGPHLDISLQYRQRGEIPEEPCYFSVGTNWSCSLRSYVLDFTGNSGTVRMQRGGAGWVDYVPEAPHQLEGSVMHIINAGSGYELDRPDGSKELFQTVTTNGDGLIFCFLTQEVDPLGNALTFTYSTNSGVFRLNSVTDGDGKVTSLYYENGSFPNRITKIVDPFSRTNLLSFDDAGYLTNIVDVMSLKSGFQYDSATGQRGFVTNMITPYGTTSFQFGGTDLTSDGYHTSPLTPNRFLNVTLPNGGHDLYIFRLNCTDFMSDTNSPFPSTSPFSSTLDNTLQNYNNSFHWGPLQYAALTTNSFDYLDSTNYAMAEM